MLAADASAAHGTQMTLRVAVGAAWEAAFAHPRVPDPLANAFAEAMRAADASAAHGTGVTLRVAAGAAWEAAFAHPRVSPTRSRKLSSRPCAPLMPAPRTAPA